MLAEPPRAPPDQPAVVVVSGRVTVVRGANSLPTGGREEVRAAGARAQRRDQALGRARYGEPSAGGRQPDPEQAPATCYGAPGLQSPRGTIVGPTMWQWSRSCPRCRTPTRYQTTRSSLSVSPLTNGLILMAHAGPG